MAEAASEPAAQGTRVSFHASIGDLDAATWNRLTGDAGPLLSHQFLSILEQTGAVGRDTGWAPMHLQLRRGEDTLAVMPLYMKTHSWGEYVFDWSWADAWHRLGIPYYPKLLTAVPMTPVTGPRLCAAPGADKAQLAREVLQAVQRIAAEHDISGWHLLFADAAETELWRQQGLAVRTHCNFQWFNRGYRDYEGFLADMTSRSRKAMRRERRRIRDQGLEVRHIPGDQASEADWRRMYRFYRDTCMRRGHEGYLSEDFFVAVGERMAANSLLTVATDGGRAVAGTLCFHDAQRLYGRYWGCIADYDSLHFELCYHSGVDFCIDRKLRHFDPGAQGEHKIRRGFIPVLGSSVHWVAEQRLRPAIADFCHREREGLEQYRRLCQRMLPFRAGQSDLLEPPAQQSPQEQPQPQQPPAARTPQK